MVKATDHIRGKLLAKRLNRPLVGRGRGEVERLMRGLSELVCDRQEVAASVGAGRKQPLREAVNLSNLPPLTILAIDRQADDLRLA